LARVSHQSLKRADVAVISILTINALRAYELIALIRKINPNCLILAGGPHATFLPEEVLGKDVDIVGQGEGEEIFAELLDWLDRGANRQELRQIDGLSFRYGLGYAHTPKRKFVEQLDRFPFPDFSLIKRGWRRITRISLQIGRGCPFLCNFCTVTLMYGHKIRVKAAVEVMVNELERMVNQKLNRYPIFLRWPISLIMGIPKVFIIDDNFFAKREVVKKFLEMIIARGLKVRLSVQARIDIGQDPEMLDLFRKAGGYSIYIGYESAVPEILADFKKGGKLTPEIMEQCTRTIHNYGIRVHGMFVLGDELETERTIMTTLKFALANADTAQFLILTPMPGTELFKMRESEGRILTRDWSCYAGHDVVFRPKNLTPEQLERLMWETMLRFYSLQTLWQRLKANIANPNDYRQFSLRQKFRMASIHLFACIIVRKIKLQSSQ
jgi:radical SAM superfamily enzyme YgiQ (UPF0313 family)